MRNLSDLLPRFGDKVASAGAIVAAIGCASCFPALASVGAAVGLGFLAQWEGLFISTLLPVFAAIAAIAQAFSWWNHRRLCVRMGPHRTTEKGTHKLRDIAKASAR